MHWVLYSRQTDFLLDFCLNFSYVARTMELDTLVCIINAPMTQHSFTFTSTLSYQKTYTRTRKSRSLSLPLSSHSFSLALSLSAAPLQLQKLQFHDNYHKLVSSTGGRHSVAHIVSSSSCSSSSSFVLPAFRLTIMQRE